MEEEKKKAYSEVVEILKLVEDEEKMEKIPFEVIELIKNNSDPTYKPTIIKDVPLEQQDLKKETYSILGWIANKYWDVDSIIEENEIDFENEIENKIEKEVINEVEEKPIRNAAVYNDIEPECLEGRDLPVLVSDANWFEKIRIKVIKLFKVLFKVNAKNKEEGVKE